MPGFQYEPYRSELTGSIASIIAQGGRAQAQALLRGADAQARAAEMSGQRAMALAGTLGGIAQGVGGQITQYYQDAPRREMEQLQLQAAKDQRAGQENEQRISAALMQLFNGEQPPTREAIISIAGPERGLKIAEGLAALHDKEGQRYDTVQKRLQAVLAGMDETPEDLRAQAYPAIRQSLIAQGVIQEKDAPPTYDPMWWQRTRKHGQEAPKAPGTREVKVRNPDGSETIQLVEDTPGQQFTSAPPKEKPPTVGSFEDYVVRYAAQRQLKPEQLSPKDIENARKAYQQADDRPININTGGGQRPLTQTAEANMIGKLANQWVAATKNASEINRQLQIMRAGVERFEEDPNGASQAVLVTFQKILDPESVVRESEYARSSQGISALQRIRGWAERISSGGAGVPLDQLREMVKTAEQFVQNTKGGLDGRRKRLEATANRYNIPKELVFEDGGTDVDAAPAAPPKVNPFRKK